MPAERATTHDVADIEGAAAGVAWALVVTAAAMAESLQAAGRPASFALDAAGQLQTVAADAPGRVLAWTPGEGWSCPLPADDSRAALISLYLPVCSATRARPITVGHLGQSLDGFIATHSGDSQFVTGAHNLVHMHRLRALCDAVVVGAGTVAADDPQLTTRHVAGPNPLRVIFDPERRLSPSGRVFQDNAAETLYICAQSRLVPGETRMGAATVVGVDDATGTGVTQVLRLLQARGCARVFIEGGGVTVSAFLEANLLDRLQIAIAPVIIGDGRPAIRLSPSLHLRDCRRPAYRVFRMGGDVLFDCELGAKPDATGAGETQAPGVVRII